MTSEARCVIEQPRFETLVFRLRSKMAINTTGVGVFVVRKCNVKLGNKTRALRGREEWFTQTRKRIARRVAGRRFHVAVRTDRRRRSFAREKLRSMTIQTRRMFGKFRDVRKRCVTFAHLLPVLRRKLVTRRTRQLLFGYVSGMREISVRTRLRPSLGGNRSTNQSESN